jgi:hypothetical protein
MAFCPKCHTTDKGFWAPKCHACNSPVGFIEQCIYSLMNAVIYTAIVGGGILTFMVLFG